MARRSRRRAKKSRKNTKRKSTSSSRVTSRTKTKSNRKSTRSTSFKKPAISVSKKVKTEFRNKLQRNPINSLSLSPFDEYPILGYKFDVVFIISNKSYNCAFQSVSGISKSTSTTKIQGGGDYDNEYHLPGSFSYKEATLKRGVLRNFGDNRNPSYLQFWFETLGWLNDYRIKTAEIQIHVKDFKNFDGINKRVTVETITLTNAYPTSVTLGDLDSQKSEVFIETVNFSYSSYSRTRPVVETPDLSS